MSKKTKVIITMAGNGSRFKEIGYTCPKHEIKANGKTLFEWSMESLTEFFGDEFIFIVRKGNYNLANLEVLINKLGIADYAILELTAETSGQGETALCADTLMSDDDQVLIFNIDTYIASGQIKKADLDTAKDGWIPAFEAEGDSWSFVKFNKKMVVTEVTEKNRISEYGTIGLYHFARWDMYTQVFKDYAQAVIKQYGESYIAPFYQYLINNGNEIKTSIIPAKDMYVLGTPGDLKIFDENYLENIE